ncbi:MAG: fabG [Clostridia bacterium]|jgi:3-oxoacyl-[acyl-carrier protein] reductase|nr:fabG [Clostridia bacterium]
MLADKVAIVTGSVRGIGKEVAMLYAKHGAKVVINYTSHGRGQEAKKVVDEIEASGGTAVAVCADVSQFEEAKALISKTVEHFGKLDILVNNAGITKDMLILRMTEEEFDRVIAVNLKGVFNCTKHASRVMLKAGGSIINMTSVVGITGNVGQANYAASKAGVIGFTKSVAREFAQKNVRVNAIAPGFIVTDMTDSLADSIKESVTSSIPMKRFGSAKDVANAALFLGSELSSYITGEIIKVDGGMAM